MANKPVGVERDSEYEEWCLEKYGPITDDEINAMALAGGYTEHPETILMIPVANENAPLPHKKAV